MDLDAVREHGDLIVEKGAPSFPVVVFDGRIAGDPVPSVRPRFDGRTKRTHHDRAYLDALEVLRYELLAGRKVAHPVADPVSVTAAFYRRTRGRVDVDNLVKTVLDAANKVLWLDDSQVVELRVRKVLGVGAQKCTRLIVRAAS